VSQPAVEPQLSAPSTGKGEAPASPPDRLQAQAPSLSVLSLFQANILVAMLAGSWARKSDGHPGPKLVGQGLMILAELVNYRRLAGRTPNTQPYRSKRPRKPG
jgi:hypothetical protein